MFTPIQQGDAFYLPVVIKQGNAVITPENADDVKIKLAEVIRKYSEGELTYSTYDGENSAWLFPLTQELTLSWRSTAIPMQVQIKQGPNVFGSDTECVPIDFSIINEEW